MRSCHPIQVTTNNVTQCCVQQNVTAGCLDACSSSYLDINVAIGRTDCFNDFDKLMKCASGIQGGPPGLFGRNDFTRFFLFFSSSSFTDGSDHRACCSDRGVPRRCLEWCRGEPVNNKMCVLSYSKSILACFHELRGMTKIRRQRVLCCPIVKAVCNSARLSVSQTNCRALRSTFVWRPRTPMRSRSSGTRPPRTRRPSKYTGEKFALSLIDRSVYGVLNVLGSSRAFSRGM